MIKLNRKIIVYLFFVPLLFFTLTFYDITTAYALSYNNHSVGIIENLKEIDNINNTVNTKIINGNIDIDKKLSTTFLIIPKQAVNSSEEISNNIINNVKEVKKQYGLIVDDKVCYVSETEEKLNEEIRTIKKEYLKKTKLDNCYNEEYNIKYDYYLTNNGYTYKDIESALNFTSSKCVYKEKIAKTKYNIKKIKDYTRVGNDKIIIQKGECGQKKITYKTTYTNGLVTNKEMVESIVIKNPKTEIISVPYKKSKNNEVLLKNVTEEQRQFINEILPGAIALYKEKNILPSLTLAQAVLESAWGTSSIGNNIYGIKAYSDWKGEKSYVWTSEQNKDGTYEKIKCWFKNYNSFAESVKDYGNLLSNSRYNAVRSAKNYRDAVAAVRLAGYATSLNYVDNIINLIENHHLYMWDKIKKPINIQNAKIQQQWNEKLKKIKKENEKNEKKEKKEKKEKTIKKRLKHSPKL